MSDSFEQIINDAKLAMCDYAYMRGLIRPSKLGMCAGCEWLGGEASCSFKQRSDLVHRCKVVAAGISFEHGDNAGGSVNIGEVATFPGVKADKAQALKVLEEAAEVFGAWQQFDDCQSPALSRWRVLAECADVIQATCNLLAAMGVTDFAPYMDACRIRNEERGRFDGRR